MSEILTHPSDWSAYAAMTESNLRAFQGDQRLISIKEYGGLYSAISVKDPLTGGGWIANIKPSDFMSIVRTNGYRVISMDCFWDYSVNELRCAAVWLPGSAGPPTSVKWGMYEGGVDSIRAEGWGLPICLRTYSIPAEPLQNPPIAFIRNYCAVYVPSDPRPWNWAHHASMENLGLQLDDERGQLVSIDTHSPNSDSVPREFTAAWLQSASGVTWFWNVGTAADEIVRVIKGACSYGVDIVPSGTTVFATIMHQFPKPPEPGAATLFTFGATANATQQADLVQLVSVQINETNLTTSTLNFATAQSFMAVEGGWSWVENAALALPTQLAPSATIPLTPSWFTTWNAKHAIFGLRAEDGMGGHQNQLVQTPLINTGLPAPPPLPITWPVFLGLMEPVECVDLADGRSLVTVYGQICNPTGQPLTVTNVIVKLRNSNGDVHEHGLSRQLRVGAGGPGEVINSSAPLINFHLLIPVQNQFSSGRLKIQLNVKFAGAYQCYGDMRELNIVPAVPVDIRRLPFDAPGISTTTGPAHRWRWDHGIGAPAPTSHSYPEHRYSYDLTVRDDTHRDLPGGANNTVNANFYTWREPIRAVSSGVIAAVVDTSADNSGNVKLNPVPEANRVFVTDGAGFTYAYAHLMQGSAQNAAGRRWAVGDIVLQGDQLGLVGNSGPSDGPHLHFGVSRRDAHGFFQSWPMRLWNVTDRVGNVVTGVPAEEEYYN